PSYGPSSPARGVPAASWHRNGGVNPSPVHGRGRGPRSGRVRGASQWLALRARPLTPASSPASWSVRGTDLRPNSRERERELPSPLAPIGRLLPRSYCAAVSSALRASRPRRSSSLRSSRPRFSSASDCPVVTASTPALTAFTGSVTMFAAVRTRHPLSSKIDKHANAIRILTLPQAHSLGRG